VSEAGERCVDGKKEGGIVVGDVKTSDVRLMMDEREAGRPECEKKGSDEEARCGHDVSEPTMDTRA
jgi:hypothetical protein